MSYFLKLFAEIWRDHAIDGVPASGPHNVAKADMRAWGETVEEGRAVYQEKGDLAAGAGSGGVGRLPVGPDGYVPVADSGQTLGMGWAPPYLQGSARLGYTSAAVITLGVGLIPLKVGSIWTMRRITAGITAGNGGLSSSTIYYVYAHDDDGNTVLEVDATAPDTDSTFGVKVKTGDATRTLVGQVLTNSSSQFFDGAPATGVKSWFNPRRFVHTEFLFAGPYNIGYANPNTSSAYAPIGNSATTSAYVVNFPLYGHARIIRAVFRAIWLSDNSGNGIRLVHADSGPSNITQIAEFTNESGGSPVNNSASVENTLQTLQAATGAFKQLGCEAKKVNGTTLTVYKVCLELDYEITDPF